MTVSPLPRRTEATDIRSRRAEKRLEVAQKEFERLRKQADEDTQSMLESPHQ